MGRLVKFDKLDELRMIYLDNRCPRCASKLRITEIPRPSTKKVTRVIRTCDECVIYWDIKK